MQAFRTDREFAYLSRKWNETSGPSYDIDVRLGGNLVVLTAPRAALPGAAIVTQSVLASTIANCYDP
jgi:hypothetical protein